MLYITGDTHGLHDIDKLYKLADTLKDQVTHLEIAAQVFGSDSKVEVNIPKLQDEIFVIIAGDFGFIWRNPEGPRGEGTPIHIKDMRTIRHVFDKMPFTVLFLDGNHENFNVIETLPIVEKWGGKVQPVTDNVYHLMRGEVYTIDNKSILTVGGGLSVDRKYRTEGYSWWPQEELLESELANALVNLEKTQNKVDLVISHTAPQSVVKELDAHLPPWQYGIWGMKIDDPTAVKLETVLANIDTSDWYFGHFHIDKDASLPKGHPQEHIKFHALYNDIKAV